MPRKKEVEIYGSLISQHRPTIRSLIVSLLLQTLEKRTRYRNPVDNDNISIEEKRKLEEDTLKDQMSNFSYFALIKDGDVEEIIVVNKKIGDLLGDSDVAIVEFDPSETDVRSGQKFDGKEFIIEEVMENEKD